MAVLHTDSVAHGRLIHHSKFHGIVAGAALLFLLAACGGGGDDAPSASTAPGVTTAPDVTPTPGVTPLAKDEPYADDVIYDMTKKGNITSLKEGAAVTHHEAKLRGKTLRYTAKVGHLVARDTQTDEPQASMSYVAFTLDGQDAGTRPVTFLFNGGPGSPAETLLMGSFAPKRVRTSTPSPTPLGPYAFEDNSETLLDRTDLVFLDPPGTGWSSAIAPKTNADFWTADADVKVDSEFVMRYLKVNGRTQSPVFIFGESYGGPRAAMMSYYLMNKVKQPLAGTVLFSPALNHYGDEVTANVTDPFFPTAAMTAWYHSQSRADADSIVSPDNKRKSVEQFRAEAVALARAPEVAAMYKEWTAYKLLGRTLRDYYSGSYPEAEELLRTRGAYCSMQPSNPDCSSSGWATFFAWPDLKALDGKKITTLIQSSSPDVLMTKPLSENAVLAGQAKAYAGPEALRIAFSPPLMFENFSDLLIPGVALGLYDSRTSNTSDIKAVVGNYLLSDPAIGDIASPHATTRAAYVHDTLKYSTASLYQGLSEGRILGTWTSDPKHVDPSGKTNRINSLPDLQQALIDNPKFKVIALSGYYDTVTPFFQTQMDIESLVLPAELKGNVSSRYFEAGHMGYADDKARQTIRADLEAFYNAALSKPTQ